LPEAEQKSLASLILDEIEAERSWDEAFRASRKASPLEKPITMTDATVPASIVSVSAPALTLRRELGKWDLTAIGVNQVIGSAVFILPSQVAAQVGNWSPIAFLAVGFASLLVALCFAEVGSRFEGTGGPYLYTRAAFGRFVAFEVGWLQWFTGVTAQAAVVNAIALGLGFYWPVITGGVGRVLMITGVILALAWVNVRGIRQSALVINLFTIAKLAPLALFIIVGFWFIDPSRLTPLGSVSLTEASTAALLLVFAFAGYHVIGIPAGEAADPRRHVPFALVATIVAVTIVMTLAQVVAMGTLPDLPRSKTPLADASLLFMGSAGALLVSAGSVIAMTGNNMGQVLTGSRTLFALAENGELPRFFGVVHRRYRTPSNAIIFTAIVALGLALSGSFTVLAVASAITRLVIYMAVSAATIRLRHRSFRGAVQPATFVISMGPLVPLLALTVSLLMLAGATRQQLLGGAIAIIVGAVLFIAHNRFARANSQDQFGELVRLAREEAARGEVLPCDPSDRRAK
jgi:basic amino acid/polyamine antiporter, APA family